MPKPCPECPFANASCRTFVIGHPNPVCMAGYPARTTLSDGMADEMDGLDMVVPFPRHSTENVRVR
ncbi:hypothetical protein [Actinophytocola sp. KF-1]